MSGIYVPIEASNVRSIIPPGENIFYSTLMLATFSMGNSTTKFNTHVLMTERGFYWTYPTKKNNPPDLKFFDWIDVLKIQPRGGMMLIGISDNLKLARVADFETKENFNKRMKEFPLIVLPHIVNRCQNWLLENENDPAVKNRRKKNVRKHLERAQNKLEKEKKKKG